MKKYTSLYIALLTQTMAMEEFDPAYSIPGSQQQSQQLPSIQEVIGQINKSLIATAHQYFYQRFMEISQLINPEPIRIDLYNFNSLCLIGYVNGTLPTLCQAISPYNRYYYYGFFCQVYDTYASLSPLTPISIVPSSNIPVQQSNATMVVDVAVAETVESEEREPFFSEAQLDYIQSHPELTPEAIYNAFIRGKDNGIGFTDPQKRLGRGDKRMMGVQAKIFELKQR